MEFPRTLSPEFWVDLTLGTDSSLGQPLSLYQVKKAQNARYGQFPRVAVVTVSGVSDCSRPYA